MRVAFVGKGGSGKTTLSALFAGSLARSGAPVLALDGDINQHLAHALGLPEEASFGAPPLSARTGEIKDFLRGSNPRIASREAMLKTTPRAAAPVCCACWARTRSTHGTSARWPGCR